MTASSGRGSSRTISSSTAGSLGAWATIARLLCPIVSESPNALSKAGQVLHRCPCTRWTASKMRVIHASFDTALQHVLGRQFYIDPARKWSCNCRRRSPAGQTRNSACKNGRAVARQDWGTNILGRPTVRSKGQRRNELNTRTLAFYLGMPTIWASKLLQASCESAIQTIVSAYSPVVSAEIRLDLRNSLTSGQTTFTPTEPCPTHHQSRPGSNS